MLCNMIKRLFANKVARNAGWIISGRVVQALIGVVVSLLTARYLGPSNYGLISYAAAYISFFNALCTLGTPSLLVKEFTDQPENEGAIIGTTLVMRLISCFLSALVMVLISCIVDFGEPTTILVVALSAVGVIFNAFDTFRYWFQYKLASKVTTIIATIAYFVMMLYRVVLLITQQQIAYFAVATSLDYACFGMLIYFAYKRHGGRRLQVSWSYGKQLLSKSYHFILTGLMVAIYSQTDKFMIKHFMGTTENGYYATGLYICQMWTFILQAIINSFYPIIMKAYRDDKEAFERYNKTLYAIVFYLCVGVSLFFTLFAKPIILILYGESYLPAVAPMRIITWYTALSYLGVARDAWIVCHDYQKYLKWVYLSSALVNVVLNLVFIPQMGATGAALASFAAQIMTIFGVPLLIKDLRKNTVLMLEAVVFKGLRKPQTDEKEVTYDN